MSTILDYVGRLSDYNVFHQTKNVGITQELLLTLFGNNDSGQICTGVHKLMQRFLLLLLTKRGSFTYDLERGTTFILDAERGYWRTVADVRLSFAAAKDSVRRQLRALEQTSDPSDEIYSDVQLNEVTIGDGRVHMTMTLITQAGSSYNFIAPINLSTR